MEQQIQVRFLSPEQEPLMSTRLTFNPMTLAITWLAAAVGLWVIAASLIFFNPLGMFDFLYPLDLFEPMQSLAESFGFYDDDGDTGLVITWFLLPLVSIALALTSLFLNQKIRH